MKRKIYNTLKTWKEKHANREALLIDGARRIGKSWIAQEFARNEYRSYILIDFTHLNEEMKMIFDNYLHSLDDFFARLQLMSGVKLYEKESLIIFDEVQRYPKAREAIKWLVADGRYHYIETGSLVSLRKNTEGITLPSEEYHVDMWPMDFEEFLWALDQEMMAEFIKDCYKARKPLGQALHRKALDLLRQYLVVGGMPQAIAEFIHSHDFVEVDHIKRNILQLYRNDIYQYAGQEAAKVAQIWDSIPGQLQKPAKRFRIGSLKKGARTREYAEAFFWLNEARVVNTCYAATEPSIGIRLNQDDSKYKLYLGDTGLLISLAFDEDTIENEELYRKLILGKLEINKGMLVENLVAQQLRAAGHPLFFFMKTDSGNTHSEIEIDFLVRKPTISSKHNINAIEVKSTQRSTTSSLDKFKAKFKNYVNEAIIIHTGDLHIADGRLYLPIYMTGLL
ncbi:MAG: ATP-binding protein [Muribaculaceae bacterium]|nr:ATP-binding protein [Muribaculaceae bacterium]